MDQATLKAIAKTILDETCQRFIINHGAVLPVYFYFIDREGYVVPAAEASSPEVANVISLGISKLLTDKPRPIDAVVTAGPAMDNTGRLVLLVTLDSTNLTLLLYRNFEWRGSDVVLLDTVYPTATSLIQLFNREDRALHYFDGMREESVATTEKTLQ